MSDVSMIDTVISDLSWLNDTISGVDIYSELYRPPTIFFDPGSTATKSLGTYKYPYKTQAEIQGIVAGNMSGQVLGFKRGSQLRVTGGLGLTLNVYGSAAKPFVICPYGDALPLPIITAGAVVTWVLHDAINNIWSYTVGVTEVDIWRSHVRQKKVAFTNNVAETLITAGISTYTANTLYLRLPPGENANDGNTEISVSAYGFDLNYSNVPASGNILVYGLDVRKGYNSSFSISPQATGSITTIDNIRVIGCTTSGSGVDNNTSAGGRDGLVIYGASNAKRITNLQVIGHYSTDCLNHAVEFAGTDGAILEYCKSYNCGGNSITELWSSNSNAIIRYNWGDFSGLAGGRYTQAGGGIFFANNEIDSDTLDTSHSKNVNNKAYFNLITRPTLKGLMAIGGSGHKFYHNTVYVDPDATTPGGAGGANGWVTAGNAANGFCEISNNLFYWKKGVQANRYPNMVRMSDLAANSSIPSGDRNVYFTDWGMSKTPFYYGTTAQLSFTNYKSAILAVSAMDQNSFCTTKNLGGTLTAASLGFVDATGLPSKGVYDFLPVNAFTPIASAVPGLTSLTGIGLKYFDGTPYSAGSATIGAFKGY